MSDTLVEDLDRFVSAAQADTTRQCYTDMTLLCESELSQLGQPYLQQWAMAMRKSGETRAVSHVPNNPSKAGSKRSFKTNVALIKTSERLL